MLLWFDMLNATVIKRSLNEYYKYQRKSIITIIIKQEKNEIKRSEE